MAKSKVKPWLPDDRSNDDPRANFHPRGENSIEWRLMDAWKDIPDAVRWHLGIILPKLTGDADGQKDALAAGWIRDIENRIRALPSHQSTPLGALTMEQLLDAADGRVSAAHNDKQKVVEECEALRQESQRRIAVPVLKLVNEFKQEISHLAASDAVKAGYLREVVSGLERLVAKDFGDAVSQAKEDVVDTTSFTRRSVVVADDHGRRRRDDISPIIDRARTKAKNRDDVAEVWLILLSEAKGPNPPLPFVGVDQGDIEYGDPCDPATFTREQFSARMRRLLAKEKI